MSREPGCDDVEPLIAVPDEDEEGLISLDEVLDRFMKEQEAKREQRAKRIRAILEEGE